MFVAFRMVLPVVLEPSVFPVESTKTARLFTLHHLLTALFAMLNPHVSSEIPASMSSLELGGAALGAIENLRVRAR